MRFRGEYRSGPLLPTLVEEIRATVSQPRCIMEVCGGQTHTIIREGIDRLLDGAVEFIHGPGCPVCVTPIEMIDRALAIARKPGVILVSFGDMLRVPGSSLDLLRAKAEGADVRIVYSPLDAVEIAERNPERRVSFFAVGFETTAPANAMAVLEARRRKLRNFTMLVAHVLVPPAMEAILADPARRVEAFIAAGHVATVMGWREYEPIALRHRVPIVVTGFEPQDILEGTLLCVRQLEEGRHEVENQYARSVRPEGTLPARRAIEIVFEVRDRRWRGIGVIPQSGLRLRREFREYDAEEVFDLGRAEVVEPAACRAGEVLRGRIKPSECPAFGRACTPEHPLGAPMVSGEGACAAYQRYGRADD